MPVIIAGIFLTIRSRQNLCRAFKPVCETGSSETNQDKILHKIRESEANQQFIKLVNF